MSWKSSLRKAFRAKDEAALDDAMEEIEKELEDKEEEGKDEEPDTIEVHNHIPGEDALGEIPPKDPATAGLARDDGEEMPPWMKKHSEDMDKRFKAMDDKINNLFKKKDDEEEADDNSAAEENLEMDRRSGKDAKDDEANKPILGELEFEAPPGTGDKATKAKDSVYLEDSFQDTVSKAEILAPGIRVPTFDRAINPVKTAKAMFALRRTALDLAYTKPETRGVIDAALSGRALDTKKLSNSSVRVLFNATASQVAMNNNIRATDRGAAAFQAGGGLTIKGPAKSIADINQRNQERYHGGRKSAA